MMAFCDAPSLFLCSWKDLGMGLARSVPRTTRSNFFQGAIFFLLSRIDSLQKWFGTREIYCGEIHRRRCFACCTNLFHPRRAVTSPSRWNAGCGSSSILGPDVQRRKGQQQGGSPWTLRDSAMMSVTMCGYTMKA